MLLHERERDVDSAMSGKDRISFVMSGRVAGFPRGNPADADIGHRRSRPRQKRHSLSEAMGFLEGGGCDSAARVAIESKVIDPEKIN
jgi:hypothetical protein